MPDITWALADDGYVQPYVVRGDILNHYMEEIPFGNTIYLKQQHNGWLPGVSITDRINNHSIGAVLSALRKGAYE